MLNGAAAQFFGYYPGTVALVTAEHEGRRNIMSAGWHSAVSMEPALYGVAIGRQRATHALVRQSGRFALSFLGAEHSHAIQGAGTLSLHDGTDKYQRLDLHPSQLHPLALHEAYLCYLCRVEHCLPTGDHDFFIGRVERVLYDVAAYDERLLLRVPAAVYLGRSEYIPLDGERRAYPPELYRR